MSGASGGDQWREMAERGTILMTPSGSALYGLSLPGNSDTDQVGICIESPEGMLGFSPFEQYIFRTAAVREKRQDAPSQPGDTDRVIYGLRKFLRLAMQGNPQILQCFFIPGEMCLSRNVQGEELQSWAPLVISRQAGRRYLGYMEGQRQRLMGERGQKKVNRPELEEAHGYDTKYAMHILRLGFQGCELLQTGRLSFPMEEKDRAFCYAVRSGEVPMQEALTKAGELEQDIKDLIDCGPLYEHPAEAALEALMIEMYQDDWRQM